MKAKLTLVGAGPGDPELISLKGVRAIASADVILYDALIDKALLEHARPEAIKIYVGKRAHLPSSTQDEINELIVEKAFAYGHVVRLKGGDPFVFARGYEELTHARSFGIETDTVIGISSVNLAGLYDIPLTLRGVNESFWVVTATTKSGKISEDVRLVAQSSATGVFLMGLGKLKLIVDAYRVNNRGDLPVAIISKGSTPEEKVVRAKVNTIVEVAAREKVATPAIILIGEAVGKQLATSDLATLNQHAPVYENA